MLSTLGLPTKDCTAAVSVTPVTVKLASFKLLILANAAVFAGSLKAAKSCDNSGVPAKLTDFTWLSAASFNAFVASAPVTVKPVLVILVLNWAALSEVTPAVRAM